METIAFKMDRRQIELLKRQAEATGRSQAAVVRDLIEHQLGRPPRASLHDQARDLCGSVSGPKDLSSRGLGDYGRD